LPITCIENAASGAEQRAARNREMPAVVRVADIYTALPSITGKIELEYEGELRGADNVARELIRGAVGRTFDRHFAGADLNTVIQWFESGGELKVPAGSTAREILPQLRKIPSLLDHLKRIELDGSTHPGLLVSAAEFLLEGLWAHRRISRSEERGFHAEAQKPRETREHEPRGGRPPRREFN